MTVTVEQTADILEAAADLIDRDGWRRGTRRHDNDGWCAAEAIIAATMDNDVARLHAAYDAVLNALNPTGCRGVVMWNDLHARDRQHVVDTLRDTARKLRGTAR